MYHHAPDNCEAAEYFGIMIDKDKYVSSYSCFENGRYLEKNEYEYDLVLENKVKVYFYRSLHTGQIYAESFPLPEINTSSYLGSKEIDLNQLVP